MKEFRIVYKEKDIQRTVKQFLRITENIKHIAFYGGMGAGKTTFITAICHELGTNDLVSSPTFSIVNEYNTVRGELIYHFDFYRINSTSELFDIGFYDYCRDEAFCFVEWPDRAEEIIPEDFLRIRINEQDETTRVLTFTL